ncbi:MAG TPA: DUF2059 domain-containing protein [Flavobacterium sp.]|uniref:DUF2059 domain-containing protein n=1 Tax=Flavobacterium sp. TaxID=239 RepID=UPI002C096261|nr:DUF2059 domain-containing protein [Flavobacterium sp.]HSD13350.1 DUF2059 domain-containing protein [Flavobacterium sp.]
MKKLLLLFALLVSVQNIVAQNQEAFKKDILKMLEINRSNSQFNEAKEQILKMIPKENHKAFLKEFDESTQPIYNKFVELYMKEFTHDDIKDLLKFYDSPLGKKMSQKSTAITQEVFNYSQDWANGLKGLVMKYMNAGTSMPPPPSE